MARRRRHILFPLDEQQRVFLRARLDTDRGEVVAFAIQLEVLTEGKTEIVMRFDTAHGYLHQHLFTPGGAEQRKRLKFRGWGEAYTYCYEYIKRNWEAASRHQRGAR